MPFFAKNRHIPDAFDGNKHRFFFTERGLFSEIHSPSWNIYRIKSPFVDGLVGITYCVIYVLGVFISFWSSRIVDCGRPVLRATFSTESPSRRRFLATSFAFFRAAPYSQYDLSMSFIMLLSIYLELKLHNFTSFCNTLNTESVANSLKSASRLSVSMARSHWAMRLWSPFRNLGISTRVIVCFLKN